MNEAETRAELKDPWLKACGWGVVDGSIIRMVKAELNTEDDPENKSSKYASYIPF